MPCIRLERTDELEMEAWSRFKEDTHRFRSLHSGEPVLTTLLGRLDRHLLPFRPFLCSFALAKAHHRTFRDDWNDLCRADLYSFLHDQIHALRFRYRLR